MQIGKNIKKIREKKGMLQKEVAIAADIYASNYSKIEKGEREPTITALNKIAQYFDMTIDQIINYEDEMPKEVTIEDKTITEKVKLLEKLDESDRSAIFKIIDGMLTKTKFKEFFNKNVATL